LHRRETHTNNRPAGTGGRDILLCIIILLSLRPSPDPDGVADTVLDIINPQNTTRVKLEQRVRCLIFIYFFQARPGGPPLPELGLQP